MEGQATVGRQWRVAFAVQKWGPFLACLPFGVVVGVLYWSTDAHQRPIYLNDFSIRLPDKGGSSVAGFWLGVAGVAIMAISITWCEVGLMSGLQTRLQGFARCLHFMLQVSAAFVFTIFFSQVASFIVGKPRPEFILGRCIPPEEDLDDPFWLSRPYDLSRCTNTDSSDYKDGRKDFPSTHCSSAAVFAFFSLVYVFGTIFGRAAVFRKPMQVVPWHARFQQEVLSLALVYWTATMVSWPWFVAVTRIRDYEHSVESAISGVVIGMICGTLWGSFALLTSVQVDPEAAMEVKHEPPHDSREVVADARASSAAEASSSSGPMAPVAV